MCLFSNSITKLKMNQMQRFRAFHKLLHISKFYTLYHYSHPLYFRFPERTQFRKSWFDQTHLIPFEALKFLIVEKPSKHLYKVCLLHKLAIVVYPGNRFPQNLFPILTTDSNRLHAKDYKET